MGTIAYSKVKIIKCKNDKKTILIHHSIDCEMIQTLNEFIFIENILKNC